MVRWEKGLLNLMLVMEQVRTVPLQITTLLNLLGQWRSAASTILDKPESSSLPFRSLTQLWAMLLRVTQRCMVTLLAISISLQTSSTLCSVILSFSLDIVPKCPWVRSELHHCFQTDNRFSPCLRHIRLIQALWTELPSYIGRDWSVILGVTLMLS